MNFKFIFISISIILILFSTFTSANSSYSCEPDTLNPQTGSISVPLQVEPYAHKIHKSLFEFLKTETKAPVIISYSRPPTEVEVKKLEVLGVEIIYKCKYIPSIQCGETSKEVIQQLANMDEVTRIELTPVLKPLLDVSARAVKARESTEYSPDTAWESGYTGTGINIAIFDSGVDDDHPSLRGKFVAGVDFSVPGGSLTPKDGSYNPDDDDGHGTSVAGIALGTGGNQGNYMGIAPEAGLIELKVSGRTGGALVNALEWCIDNKNTDWNGNGPDENDGIDILSISLGDSTNSDGTDSASQLLNRVVDSGIVVVVAVGNEGPNNNGMNSFAAADKVVAVGNLDIHETVERSDDVIDTTSTRGPRSDDGDSDPYDELKPEVCAPGTNTMAPRYSVVGQRGNGYRNFGGSSAAAPHVAGICALMLEANPALSPGEIKEILKDTADAKGEPDEPELSEKYNYAYGFGSVEAYKAVRVASGFNPQNHKPEILEVVASPRFVELGDDVTITTTAYDEDSDVLSYNYSATAGEISGTGPEVTWTAPDEAGNYEITVIVDDGRLYSDPETVIITVEEELENHAPEITNIYVSRRVLGPGENTTIKVTAEDPDDDQIFYDYEVTGGTIIGVGSEVNWIAPDVDGKYTITIVATDGELNSNKEKVVITVEGAGENRAPTIDSFTATPQVINSGGLVRLTVQASDPESGELLYIYSAAAGVITGTGPEVTWTAPEPAGSVVITATVQDPGGLTDSETIVVEVYQQNYAPEIIDKRANPSNVKSDGTVEVLFTVRVTDKNGEDDISAVTIDLSSLFGSDQQKLYDNGKQGDSVQDDGIYSVSYVIPRGVSDGQKRLTVSVKDRFNEVTKSQITINVTAVAGDDDSGLLGTELKLPGFDSGLLILAILGFTLFIAINRSKSKRFK